MRKNHPFDNPTCDVKSCPRFGKTMEQVYKYSYSQKGREAKLVIYIFVCRGRKSRAVGRGPVPGRHYTYRALPNWSPMSCVGTGHYVGTDIKTGEPLETELVRKHGSSLMPHGQWCPQCGGEGVPRGPNPSVRLGEPIWRLRCQQGHTNIYWKRADKLELLPSEALFRLHSRNQSGVQFPRCERRRCKGFGRAMNAQHKKHPYDGGTSEILHCRCRYADRPHDLFVVLPGRELATKEGPGLYSWVDSKGNIHRTIPYKRAPKKQPRGHVRGYVGEQNAARITITAHRKLQKWNTARIAQELYPKYTTYDARNLFKSSVLRKHKVKIEEKMRELEKLPRAERESAVQRAKQQLGL